MKISNNLRLILHPKEWHFAVFGVVMALLAFGVTMSIKPVVCIALIVGAGIGIFSAMISDTSEGWGYKKYNKDVDDFLVDALENNGTFTKLSEYTIDINGVTFWIENYPHSFVHPYPGRADGNMPSGKTKKRLYDKLLKDTLWKNQG